jgi:geranylgeranyl pyrophosphate synthase
MSMTQTSFAGWLADEAARVDAALLSITKTLPASGAVAEVIRFALDGGGKRLRPVLCSASYQAVARKPAPDTVIRLACSIELIHTYSLVHDDLPCMDNGELRRGRPTAHRVFGDREALMGAAALIPLAFKVLLDAARELGLDSATIMAAGVELARAAGASGMVGGQALDLASEGRAITLDQLEGVHRAKTGALIAAAARIGALGAGASKEQLAALRSYGRCIGLAFQIIDDVLDETTASNQLGKTAGKDRAVAKATFPAMMGLEAAQERAHQEMAEALAALDVAALRTSQLQGLARFAVDRDR